MNEIGGADRETCVSRGRLHENPFERRLIENFPVGNAIESDTAGETNGLLPGLRMQLAEHFEQNFFQARLQRRRDVEMHLLDRSGGVA